MHNFAEMEKIWHVPAYFVRTPLPYNFFRGKNVWFLHQMDISLQSDGQRAEMSVDTGIILYILYDFPLES